MTFSSSFWAIAAFLMLFLGIGFGSYKGFDQSWYFLAAAGIFGMGYFLFHNVRMALLKLKQGNIHEAENLINKIKYPNSLLKNHQGYYHFVKGLILLQKKQNGLAIPYLQSAINIGLKNPQDQALAELNLAHLKFVNKKYNETKMLLQKIKAKKIDDLLLKEKVRELEKALKNI